MLNDLAFVVYDLKNYKNVVQREKTIGICKLSLLISKILH